MSLYLRSLKEIFFFSIPIIAGQLGQMLGFAGQNLDLEFVFLDPAPNPPDGYRPITPTGMICRIIHLR